MFKRSNLSWGIKSALAAAAVTAMNTPAFAQNDINLAIEEIIVTARKTEENMQTIPMAMDAISTTTIQEKGVSNIEDVAQLSASLVFDTGLMPNDTRPVIRGVSSTRGRANVATLIDDVDITSEALTTGGGGITANLRLMDLERVEIVKGPQSVLYGRSAFTGAVNYVTKKPEEEFSGVVDVNLDEHGTQEAKLSVTGALTETISARATVSSWETDGWYENPNTGGDLGDGDSTGISLSVQWAPTDEFTALVSGTYSDEHYGLRPIVNLPAIDITQSGMFGTGVVNPGNESLPVLTGNATADAGIAAYCASDFAASAPYAHLFDPSGNTPACIPQAVGKVDASESQLDLSPDTRTGKDFKGTDVESTRLALDLRWEFEDYEFRSITGYTENTSKTENDFDQNNYDQTDWFGQGAFGFSAMGNIEHDVEQISQEFRFLGTAGDFDYFLSALYWDEKMKTDEGSKFWARQGSVVDPSQDFFVRGPDFTIDTINLDRETEHKSIAGSLTYNLEDWSFTVEGRYLEEDIDYKGNNYDLGAYTSTGGEACGFGLFAPSPTDFAVVGGLFDTVFGFPTNPDATLENGCGTSENSVSANEFVPRASVNYQINRDAMVYLTYAEGFKPGGVVTTDANGEVSQGEFKPESVESLELGFKTAWMANSLTFNGAIFNYDYTDQQVSITSQEPGEPAQSQVVNAGESTIFGYEFDLAWQATEALSMSMGYVYADSEYDNYNLTEIAASGGLAGTAVLSDANLALAGNSEGDFSGKQMALSAKHAATVVIRYEQPVLDNLWAIAEVNGSYQSKRFVDDGNNAYLPSHQLWNVQLGVNGDNWKAILYVDNVLDDDTIRSGLNNTDYGNFVGFQELPKALSLVLPQPRTTGVRFSYLF
ncbi:TonB-dependent receptor [Oceanicoccus sp. KOV_DT_Chl]|uniref:TonB-dependent receptor n=1 Tax=Oceanicoccus sp. KOV_DT_Chl TaxID=1904639 RepID=UPI000C7C243C|nr:TonB-dependent receptor [Oceanicoccus sp. KOV_DT_Chl]